MIEKDKDYLPIGRVGKTKGLKGHLFFDLYNPYSSIFETAREVFLKEGKSLPIEEAHSEQNRILVKFEGISSVEEAQKLTRQEVFVARKDLSPLKDGEHYIGDLVGFEVVNEDGKSLGKLQGVMTTPANDVYVVKGNKEELLIPMISGVLQKIDSKDKKIWVNNPEVINAF